MTVYLDLVVILNFLVDFLLLLGTNRLSGFPAAPGRCALAAALGSVYAAGCLLPGFRFLGNLLWRCVSLCLMALVAFGFRRDALKRGGVFLLLSLSLGGMALCFTRQNFAALTLGAVGVWLLCRVAFGDGAVGREYVPVTLHYQGRTASFTALRDTGNTLRDPITGEPVLVVSGDIGEKLTGLTAEQLASPLETLAARPLPGLRLIPYRAVGGSGLLLALRFPGATVGKKTQNVLVAFAAEGLGQSKMYQGLTGGAL
ncbi:MAG: sigma-E processing peptidase SpoIIGA [Candidatus Faecousia sp.]|nr:sigma-E processing peptidase SpoIIGA [Candidatus Faecousia sp.]